MTSAVAGGRLTLRRPGDLRSKSHSKIGGASITSTNYSVKNTPVLRRGRFGQATSAILPMRRRRGLDATVSDHWRFGGVDGLEPAAPGVTGRGIKLSGDIQNRPPYLKVTDTYAGF
jgi:hypothetical protein